MVLFFIGGKLESSNAIYAGTSPRQRVYALLAMLGRAEVQVELGGRSTAHTTGNRDSHEMHQ
jgi:hypothetical protein